MVNKYTKIIPLTTHLPLKDVSKNINDLLALADTGSGSSDSYDSSDSDVLPLRLKHLTCHNRFLWLLQHIHIPNENRRGTPSHITYLAIQLDSML